LSLVDDFDFKPTPHERLRGISFLMQASNRQHDRQRVRVIVTLQALASLSEAKVDDMSTALESFEMLRDKLAAAAASKYSQIGSQIQDYEGVPTFLLMTGDAVIMNAISKDHYVGIN
jgi:hypothetical protein